MKPIITSMLDTDFYKITMGQCVYHQYPNAIVKYVFKCRNKDVKLGFLASTIKEQVKNMETLFLTSREKTYLSSFTFICPDYLDFLEQYRFKDYELEIKDDNGDLSIGIGGFWSSTIFWEVPLLAIVNQLYFEATTKFDNICETGKEKLRKKTELISLYPRFTLTDFGTRRRYSANWQEYVVKFINRNCSQFVGTSNVKLAMDLGLKVIGTCAHEFFFCSLSFG